MTKPGIKGFTIVELLIVIVVIAILASISIVAYNGIQQRARDSNIKSVASSIQKSVRLWQIDTGILPVAGYGSTGAVANDSCPGNTTSSGGWFQSGVYLCSMQDVLKARGLLTNNLTASLPKNNVTGSSAHVFMFYPCGTNRSVLLYYLENPSSEETANYNSTMATCGLSAANYKTSYGMQAASIIAY